MLIHEFKNKSFLKVLLILKFNKLTPLFLVSNSIGSLLLYSSIDNFHNFCINITI